MSAPSSPHGDMLGRVYDVLREIGRRSLAEGERSRVPAAAVVEGEGAEATEAQRDNSG